MTLNPPSQQPMGYFEDFAMEDSGNTTLTARVQRAVEDLNALRQSLLAISEQSAADPEGLTLDVDRAMELKSAIDALRMLLYALSLRPGYQRLSPDFVSDFDRLINSACVVAERHGGANSQH